MNTQDNKTIPNKAQELQNCAAETESMFSIATDCKADPDWHSKTVAMALCQEHSPIPIHLKADGGTVPSRFGDAQLYAIGNKAWEDNICKEMIGIRLDDLVLLDLDLYKENAIPRSEVLAIVGGEPLLVQENEKGNSPHYLSRIPKGYDRSTLKNSNIDWMPGVDLLTGNQLMYLKSHKIIIGGELPARDDIPDTPKAILEALTKPKPKNVEARTDSPASKTKAAEIVSYIDPDIGYKDWLAVGIGLHAEFDGDSVGLAVWDEWSAKGEKYSGIAVLEYKWGTFKAGGSTTFASACDMAKKGGADLSKISRTHPKITAADFISKDDAVTNPDGSELTGKDIKALLLNIPKTKRNTRGSIIDIACGLKTQMIAMYGKPDSNHSWGFQVINAMGADIGVNIKPVLTKEEWLNLDLTKGYTFKEVVELSGKTIKKSFSDFALNGSVDAMRQQMLDDVYILGEFAILGQITNLFAAPNTGKTVVTIKLLIDAVASGNIKGKDVFYINADDTYRGLVTKTELVGGYGINMLAPGHNGFERSHVEEILKSMTEDNSAKGKIVIIDTLKKFSDLMDKKASSEFMELLRQFVSKGGSAILLAHINKKRDDEGKPIFQGTTDSVDDADCCYTIDCIKSETEKDDMFFEVTYKTIIFENFKARGDVTQKYSYSYEVVKGQPYKDIINSFKSVDEVDALHMKEQQRILTALKDNKSHIECVLDGIAAGEVQKTQILERLVSNQAISKAAARTILDAHEGDDYQKGHRWECKKGGDRNVKIYHPVEDF